ncbi:MAG: hypothetical protein LBO09_00275 [Candidatus Peribacteria bacterium]|jgi:hypothetical protein|nr:hypothetical protein [Candidatus Peribacteria bacterium]
METKNKTIQVYVAVDGTEWEKKGECIRYEESFMEKYACPHCKGNGRIFLGYRPCVRRVEKYRIGHNSIYEEIPDTEPNYEPCPVCHGKKYLKND